MRYQDTRHLDTVEVCFSTSFLSTISHLTLECNTRYYPNFYVHTCATIQMFYRDNDIPFIQTSQHFYMAAELCKLFATMMVTSWYAVIYLSCMQHLSDSLLRTSAMNCARIYNCSMHNHIVNPMLPADWPTSLELDVEDVWNGFYIHALILEHRECGLTLELTHNAESQAA